jgi:beta-N-acetylhexosaminidase
VSAAAGSVLICAVEGTALTSVERAFYAATPVSGLTLFTRNIPHPDYRKLRGLVGELQSLRPAGAPPLVVAIDQEGGRVNRFKTKDWPDFPNEGPALQLAGGKTDFDALQSIRSYARTVARALAGVGINTDFAPVCDIDTEPTNTAIGDRCFAKDAEGVTLRAGAFLDGLQDEGVLGSLKHFPGQGDARVDTHYGKGVIDLPRGVLDRRELAPFRALLPRAPMVMISHCVYPALAPEEASLSPRIMNDLLRGELGFTGVVVSDDMTMGAMAQDDAAWGAALVSAVLAGADMLLVCRHIDKCRLAYEVLEREAARSPAFARRLAAAAARVVALRRRLTA